MINVKVYKHGICAILAVLAAVELLAGSASAVGIDDMSVNVNPNTIEVGEDFNVEIRLENPDATKTGVDLDIEVTVDGILVHKDTTTVSLSDGTDRIINLSSSEFNVDGDDVWSKNWLAWRCIDEADVEVAVSGDIDDVTDSDQLTIEPSSSKKEITDVKLDPETLSLDDKVTVTVYDEDDDPLKSANVKFTYIEEGNDDGVWDVDDKYKERSTDSDGETTFTLSKDISSAGKGRYQLDVKADGYCKVTQLISIQNSLNISDPEPASPKVGEQFKLRVTTPAGTPAVGLLVTLNPGGIKSKVLMDGYAPYTLTAPGTYTVIVGGGTTGFDEVMKTVKVSAKASLLVSVSPDPVSVNKPVVITVTSDGKPIDGATVKVTPPGSTEQTLSGTTSNTGTISYTPTVSGDHVVRASKQAFDDASETFGAKNSFQIEVPAPSMIKKGAQLVITVKDQSGAPVSGASISVGGDISGITDQSGRYGFILQEVGTYNVVVKKTGFIDEKATFASSGQLTVKLDRKEITLDDSVKVTVVDADGNPTEASIKVYGPGGTDTASASEYTATPKKAGEYTIEASKQNYQAANEKLKVNPRPLALAYYFKGSQLVINATSNGKPAVSLRINVKSGNSTNTAVTDSAGMALFQAPVTGDYIITVDSLDYASNPVTAAKSTSSLLSDLWVPVLIILVGLVLIGIFAVVLMSLLQRRGRGAKPTFKRAAGSRLGG